MVDYQLTILGLIVGVLSILVTILIGWQIYSAIQVDKKMKEINNVKLNMDEQAIRTNLKTSMALSDFFYTLVTPVDPKEYEYKYLYYRIVSLFNASLINDIETERLIVKALLETVHFEMLAVQSQQKEHLLKLFHNVRNGHLVPEFEELSVRLLNLKSYQA